MADLPGRDRHDLRAGLGARPASPAARRRPSSPIATACCITSPPPSPRPRTAARNRERLLRDFLEYRRSAVERGRARSHSRVLTPPAPIPSRADRLARPAGDPGHRGAPRRRSPSSSARARAGRRVPRVPLAQPTGRLVRNLLDPTTEQSAEFIKEQDASQACALTDQIYDITAWSLPLLVRRGVVTCPAPIPPGHAVPSGVDAPRPPRKGAGQGRLPDALGIGRGRRRRPTRCGTASASGAWAALHAQRAPLCRRHGAVPRRREPRRPAARFGARHGARCEVVPIDSTWVDEGISLGSNNVAPLKAPRVLLVWDTPTQTLSAAGPATCSSAGSARR